MTRIPISIKLKDTARSIKNKLKKEKEEASVAAELKGDTWIPPFKGWTHIEQMGDAILCLAGYKPSNPATLDKAVSKAFDEFAENQLNPKFPLRRQREIPWGDIIARAGFTTDEAAARVCGISVGTLSNLKNGKTNCKAENLRKTAMGLILHAPDERSRGFIAYYLLNPTPIKTDAERLQDHNLRMRQTIELASRKLTGNALKALYAVSASLLQAMPDQYPPSYSDLDAYLPGYAADIVLNDMLDCEARIRTANHEDKERG